MAKVKFYSPVCMISTVSLSRNSIVSSSNSSSASSSDNSERVEGTENQIGCLKKPQQIHAN